MQNSYFEKVPAKGTLVLFTIALLAVLVLLIFNIQKDKPFYIYDKRFGFGASVEEEILKQKSDFKATVEKQELEIKNLNDKISNLNDTIQKLKIESENSQDKYSRKKEVYLEENFEDSISGVNFSLIGVTKVEGKWFYWASLFVPESGEFKRYIELTDSWDFFHNKKKFNLSFLAFNPEETTITLQVTEI